MYNDIKTGTKLIARRNVYDPDTGTIMVSEGDTVKAYRYSSGNLGLTRVSGYLYYSDDEVSGEKFNLLPLFKLAPVETEKARKLRECNEQIAVLKEKVRVLGES